MTDGAGSLRFLPLRANILAEVPPWLKKLDAEAQVLVYFSGHGFLDRDGVLYLAPADCDPNDPAATGIPVKWLRDQLESCPARFKLLVLDVCHAGSDKGEEPTNEATAKELAEAFEAVPGVITLASSTSQEKSWELQEMRQSVFSYWFTQGLKGHADDNGDGEITVDELYQYVHRNVTRTVAHLFPGLTQTPVRIIGPRVPGVPVVVRPKPGTLKGTLDEMAEQLAICIRNAGVTDVGVTAFMPSTSDPKLLTILGGDFGHLGRYCGEELQKRLEAKKSLMGDCQLVAHESIHKALVEGRYSVGDLFTRAVRGLQAENTVVKAIALGQFCVRTGRVITLQCTSIGTERQEVIGKVGGTAWLNESEWAMIGRSVQVRPEDYLPPPVVPVGLPPSPTTMRIHSWESRRGHPMLDPNFPFPVSIVVRGQPRKGVFRGDDLFVPLRQGETYEIWVENRSGKPVMMRLLVDGLNTLPEPVTPKAVSVEPKLQYLPAQRVSLDEARAWELDPARAKVFAVRGFWTQTGPPKGVYREFRVVDAHSSVAAQQHFTEQVGLITAAFYEAVTTPREARTRGVVGTAYGKEREEILEPAKFWPGRLLAVVHIRYVEPDELKTLEAEQSSSVDTSQNK